MRIYQNQEVREVYLVAVIQVSCDWSGAAATEEKRQ